MEILKSQLHHVNTFLQTLLKPPGHIQLETFEVLSELPASPTTFHIRPWGLFFHPKCVTLVPTS